VRSAVAVILLALMMGVLLLIIIEIRKWQTGRSVISRRRFRIRMVGGGLLWALATAVFLGIYVLGPRVLDKRPVLFLAYWLGCLAAAFVLMFLAIADMREVETRQTQREVRMWREMARLIAGKPEPENDTKDKPGSEPQG